MESQTPEMFVWGQEATVEPTVLIKRRTETDVVIRGVPIVKVSSDPEKSTMWLEVVLEPIDFPNADLITDRLFFPDDNCDPRQVNRRLRALNEFEACFGWSPATSEAPQVGQEFNDLADATGRARIGIEEDSKGQYDDKNSIMKYLPAVA